MHKLKEMLMNELYEYEEKAKRMSGGKISQQELDKIHKMTDTVKNICKIDMYEEYGEDGESSYAGGSSYARGRGRNARRDSMGRYSREGGSSYDGGYSEEGSYRGGNSSYRGGSSYEGGTGGNMGGNSSYARGGRGGYSYDGAKEHMLDKMEEMMEMAESEKERKAIHRCMQELENA